jgi:heme-degrading monooxygenase HmoA
MEPVFRVLLRMQVHQGMERDFEETMRTIGDAIRRHPANLDQWLTKSAEEEGVYYVISDWIDEAQFRTFERSDEHLEHRKKLHPFRSGISMRTGHILYHLSATEMAQK